MVLIEHFLDSSTMFLMGPISQLKRMFIPSRIIATCIFLVAIAMALFFGYVKVCGGGFYNFLSDLVQGGPLVRADES